MATRAHTEQANHEHLSSRIQAEMGSFIPEAVAFPLHPCGLFSSHISHPVVPTTWSLEELLPSEQRVFSKIVSQKRNEKETMK